MPNIAAGDKSLWPTRASARCCTHSVLNSCARIGFSCRSSIFAHVSQVVSLVGSAFTPHLYSWRASATLPSRSSKTPQAWNSLHALRLRGATHTPRCSSSRARSTCPAFHSAMAHACQLAWCSGSSLVPCSNSARAASRFPSLASSRASACSKGGSPGFSLHPLRSSDRARSTYPHRASYTAHDKYTYLFSGSTARPFWNSFRACSPPSGSRVSSMAHACHSTAERAPASVRVPSRKCSRASATLPRSIAITPNS
mmetsp:Transcript_5825/g.24666  ORF Transcript_5825/g.24666 Transcript_5825/m.24666 type:complete len:255 (-) Transcript_5825:820-1584(-)